MLVSTVALATSVKDTLHVERIITAPNGTSSGLSVTAYEFSKRYRTPALCTAAATAYAAETIIVVGGRNLLVATKAVCEDINHSIYQ